MRILNLAPHLSLPPRNGADLRTWKLAGELGSSGNEVHLLSRFFPATAPEHLGNVRTGHSSFDQLKNVIRALILKTCYWQTKMLTRDTWDFVNQTKANDYDAVIVNFLYSAPLLKALRGRRIRVVLETHNCDEEYFGRMAAASTNPLVRQLCGRAVKVSLSGLRGLPKGVGMSHVSNHDAAYYCALRRDLEHAVVPNACTPQIRRAAPRYEDNQRRGLLFVGSLSSRMNQDALTTFAAKFWPQLQGFCDLTIAGSNPSRSIRTMCREHAWLLCPNVADHELQALYECSHFAVLPFAYAAGSKLKLFEAVGRGVPVVSTRAGVSGLEAFPDNVFVSDYPEDWATHIGAATRFGQPTHSSLHAFSWKASAEIMDKLLNSLSPLTI